MKWHNNKGPTRDFQLLKYSVPNSNVIGSRLRVVTENIENAASYVNCTPSLQLTMRYSVKGFRRVGVNSNYCTTKIFIQGIMSFARISACLFGLIFNGRIRGVFSRERKMKIEWIKQALFAACLILSIFIFCCQYSEVTLVCSSLPVLCFLCCRQRGLQRPNVFYHNSFDSNCYSDV